MDIKITAAGKLSLTVPQQGWSDGNAGDPAAMQVARFAGQEMMVITDNAKAFDLRFMGYQTGGFATMEAAKAAAPEFARKVFDRLVKMISD